MENKQKIIIFGGSFDPIHNSHITLCKYSKDLINADKLILVPSKNPRWKSPTETISDRLNMIKLILNDYHLDYKIEECEVNSWKDVDYTIETIEYLQQKHKNAEFYLLIGADQVNKFNKWRKAKEIAEAVQIIYYPRPGYVINQNNVNKYKMRLIDGVLVDTSSTKIRDLNSLDTSISVINYIIDNNLYFMNKINKYLSGSRLKHSISVANLAYQVAVSNNLEMPGTYFLTGLIHDIGKNVDTVTKKEIMEKYFRKYSDIPEFAYHQFVGVAIAIKEFGITNDLILNAIMFHCTGNSNLSPLAKVIYACDKIDPLRGYDSKFMIDKLMENYEDGFKLVVKENYNYLKEKCKDSIDLSLSKKCFDNYL